MRGHLRLHYSAQEASDERVSRRRARGRRFRFGT